MQRRTTPYLLMGCFLFIVLSTCLSCKSTKQASEESSAVDSSLCCPVTFDGDSALAHVKAQCDFGARVPNSAAHAQCGDYIVEQFKRLGLSINEQRTDVKAWDGKVLHVRNIIGSFRPEAQERIVLAAHYDSRPWCDQDADSSKRNTPVMAADDGASGVAVLIEVARQLQKLNPKVGVDLVCFDAEDYGAPDWAPAPYRNNEDTWCLGSQHWSKEAVKSGYRARYGVLLDMVGGSNSRFRFEGYSLKYAQPIITRTWDAARYADAADFFPQENGSYITDDHLPMNQIAKIPTIDIIAFDPNGSGFVPYWHTTRDTPENISPNTLRAVGQTLLQLLHTEE